MAQKVRWGILATGSIAHQFAGGLKVSKTGVLQTSGSRDLEKAKAFAEKHGGRGVGSYDEVLADPEVDAVYIATPHHLHAEWTIKAARAGKAILCEKPFTMNAPEAEATLKAVEEAGVFFMEAFMYRCAPQTRQVAAWLAEGAIGQVRAVSAEFSFGAGRGWDNFRAVAALGGGGLMDVGCYAVSFARLAAGCEPDRAHYVAHLDGDGYDGYGSGCLGFPNGVTAHIGSGIHLSMRNDGLIYGDAGQIHVQDPWKCGPGTKLTLRQHGKEPQVLELGCTNDELYGYEADAVAEFMGGRECPYVTWEDTMQNMRTLDALRRSAGVPV